MANAERLLKLADFLETIPKKRFDFSSWASNDFDETKGTCGTTACALGWATAIPEFAAMGLRLAKCRHGTVGLTVRDETIGDAWQESLHAASSIFDLAETETEYLFTPRPNDDEDVDDRLPGWASAKDVANHIRAFVERECSTAK